MTTCTTSKWKPVTKRAPCPVCERDSWCTVSPDGQVVFCMRVASDSPKELSNGAVGYVHVLGKTTVPKKRRTQKYKPLNPMFAVQASRAHEATSQDDIESLALDLGVSMESLVALSAGLWRDSVWSFPMRTPNGKVSGIRLRSTSGKKWAVRGSKDGLFFDPSSIRARTLYVTEGPTDTAALMTLGAAAVGRSSCMSGGNLLAVLCKDRTVVIVSDNDAPKTRPDGSHFYPGQEGSARLADRLAKYAKDVYVIHPPWHKDIRQWVQEIPELRLDTLWQMAVAKGPWNERQ